MRLLWVSDSPTTPSGFGGVTREVCSRLHRRGHRIEILGWQTHGSTSYWHGIPVHPVRHNQFGADVVLGYMQRFRPDFVLTLADVWWMSFMADPAVQRYLDQSGARWAHYYPLDGADPSGRLPASWVKALQVVDVRVAMSRFGVDVTHRSGLDCAYVPHGCALDVFAPPADKEAAKARFGYSGSFVVMSDARNQPRKLLPRLLDIAGMFAQDKPDVMVHLHTDPEDEAASSDLYRYALRQDLAALGLKERVRFTPNFRMRASGGIALEELASVYQCADVHLLCSWGEGFGLPNLQAASAGVVPIAVAYAASRELVEGHGFAIPAESGVLDEFGLVRCLLSREAAVNALNELYYDSAALAERSGRSRAFAQPYAWDTVVAQWEEVLRDAPPRRKPTRSKVIIWTAGARTPIVPLPQPAAEAMVEAFAPMPDGTRVRIQLAERRQGEVSSEIYRSAFVNGDELSIPVRLPPGFGGAPRARIGHLLVSPGDLPLAVLLKRIFPGISIAIPRPGGDPSSTEHLTLERLLPALVHCCLALDYDGRGGTALDLACAALGVPYAGSSELWPDIGPSSPLHQVRLLLTDHGLSEWRRRVAMQRAEELYGPEIVASMRATALAGQPSKPSQPSQVATPELFLVRPATGNGEGNEQIAEHVARQGGLVLMATGQGSLIVAMPAGGKELLERCPSIGFVGGITLDGQGKAFKALRHHFAVNAARQLAARGQSASAGAVALVGHQMGSTGTRGG